MTKKKRIILIASSILLTAIIIAGIATLISLKKYKKTIAAIKIKNIDLSKIADGNYIGSATTAWVAVKVRVTIKNHRIAVIKLLKHKHGRGKKAEAIIGRVLKQQSLKIDVISGATSSSKLILKAIEKALTKK